MNKTLVLTALLSYANANIYENMHNEHKRLHQSNADNAQFEPIVGRNLVSVLLTDVINIFMDPSWATLMAAFI